MTKKLIIIGAGPAGLTSAYKALTLSKDLIPVVLEKDKEYVGGISRTVDYKGFKFDIGGHRFFSKSAEVEDLWTEIMGADMLERPRLSRIFYGGKFYSYPLKPVEAFLNLGVIETSLILLSYLKAKLFPFKNPKNFEEWVSNHFGFRLYNLFFKTYTEKVWGMSCKDISADWAAQRIKGLSISTLILETFKNLFGIKRKDGKVIKTLIDKFRYPKLGPGHIWGKTRDLIESMGGEVKLDQPVSSIKVINNKVYSITTSSSDGKSTEYTGDYFISTMPIKELINAITPKAPEEVIQAANNLKYRDFLTVSLIVDNPEIFPDNWIYIHDASVLLGRIQNFKNWSPSMVPDSTKSCLGLEYFCFGEDALWNMADEDLIALGKKEVEKLGLVKSSQVVDGKVVRMLKAYPVYDDDYKKNLATVRSFTDKIFNLYLVGRNGMHKYNNQDHSMMAGIIAVKNILGDKNLDPWKVNADAEYHESVEEDIASVM